MSEMNFKCEKKFKLQTKLDFSLEKNAINIFVSCCGRFALPCDMRGHENSWQCVVDLRG